MAPAASAAPEAAGAAPVAPAPVRPGGVVVVAVGETADQAWPVAQHVYASATLRPPKLDEARARTAAGEPPPEGAEKSLRDVAELRASVRGDDAASRASLTALAKALGVPYLLVVERAEEGAASARLFRADSGTFDGTRYGADDAGSWVGSIRALEVTLEPPPAPKVSAAATANHERLNAIREGGKTSKPFWLQPWFWAAVGGAALIGGAVVLATRDTSPSTIHLQMKLPQ
jgi:hypothetical protein